MVTAYTPGRLNPFIAEFPKPEATILVTGHTAGWLTPCGCRGDSGGGFARKSGYRRALQAVYRDRPVFFVDTGGFAHLGSDVADLLTDAVSRSMRRVGYATVGVGREDLGGSLAQFDLLGSKTAAPRVSANLVYHDNGKPVFDPYRILEAPPAVPGDRPLRIAVFGLNNDRAGLFVFGPDGRSVITEEMDEAMARYLPEARGKADYVLLIGEFRVDQAYKVVVKNPGMIDMIFCGEGGELLKESQDIQGVPAFAVGNEGKYMGEIRIWREGGKPKSKARVFLVDDRFPSDMPIALENEQVLDQVNEASKRELGTGTPEKPSIAPFVGAGKCASCHQEAYRIWGGTKHSRAFATLEAVKRDFTVSCTMCHVTGQGGDVEGGGGFTNPVATPDLTNIQCEACHGAGAAHLADPSRSYGQADSVTCHVCHTPEQDPDFDYDKYWPRIAHH